MNDAQYRVYISTFKEYRAAIKRIIRIATDKDANAFDIKKCLLYCVRALPRTKEDIELRDIIFEIIKIDYPEYYEDIKKLSVLL